MLIHINFLNDNLMIFAHLISANLHYIFLAFANRIKNKFYKVLYCFFVNDGFNHGKNHGRNLEETRIDRMWKKPWFFPLPWKKLNLPWKFPNPVYPVYCILGHIMFLKDS